MQLYTIYFICKMFYMFRVVSPPIMKSTNNSIYSIWYWSIVAAVAVTVDQYQMLQVQSFMLLMMGGETTRNM